MLDENLISTLEQSLRQTRNAQHRLMSRLNEVEAEADRLRQEIDALENSAKQTSSAIYSLLATIRSGKQSQWNLPNDFEVDEYELPSDIQRLQRMENRSRNQQQQLRSNQNINQNYQPQNDYRNNNNNNNTVAYLNNQHSQRSIPNIAPNIEPISNRFADRTITQACKLLLLEAGKPLHVNELYNFLVSGGFEFKGNNPTISIAVSLNRNRRFRKVAPGTFDLVMREASQAAS
jgi:DNA repair exonuclease SbcCD ATPase subunit